MKFQKFVFSSLFLLGALPQEVFPKLTFDSDIFVKNTETYIIYQQKEIYHEISLREKINKIFDALESYSKENLYPVEICRNKPSVDIFILSKEELNYYSLGLHFKPYSTWGVYDPDKTMIVMMVPFSSQRKGEEVLAHEISHYWYDIFCWERYWNRTPEEFALKFETYYENNYLK